MTPELQTKLYNKYPAIFVQKDLPMTHTCMCWGLDVGDGWYKIIDELCAAMTPIIEKANNEMSKESNDFYGPYAAVQVKEKFGTLRFYMNYHMDEVEKLISKAERLSAVTCETCGERAECRNDGWIMTLCDSCHEASCEKKRKAKDSTDY